MIENHLVRGPDDITDQLMAAAGGDPELASEVASVFLTELPRLIDVAQAALLSGDNASFRRVTHTVTGCSATIGFSRLAGEARTLERVGIEGMVTGDMERLVEAAEEAVQATRAYLRGAA
jgi:HPt (histidine-containing phosphotransfer) domain-containing protein